MHISQPQLTHMDSSPKVLIALLKNLTVLLIFSDKIILNHFVFAKFLLFKKESKRKKMYLKVSRLERNHVTRHKHMNSQFKLQESVWCLCVCLSFQGAGPTDVNKTASNQRDDCEVSSATASLQPPELFINYFSHKSNNVSSEH